MAGNFCGKSEKTLKISFHGLKFRDNYQSRGMALHSNDLIDQYMRSISLAIFFVTIKATYRDLDK